MDERKSLAADQVQPFKERSTAKSQQAAQWAQCFNELKNTPLWDLQAIAIAEAEAKIKELTREAREQAAKAKEIEDSVYDLKAVSPHKKTVVDTRTPEELIDLIEAKGKEIAEALAMLRNKKS